MAQPQSESIKSMDDFIGYAKKRRYELLRYRVSDVSLHLTRRGKRSLRTKRRRLRRRAAIVGRDGYVVWNGKWLEVRAFYNSERDARLGIQRLSAAGFLEDRETKTTFVGDAPIERLDAICQAMRVHPKRANVYRPPN